MFELNMAAEQLRTTVSCLFHAAALYPSQHSLVLPFILFYLNVDLLFTDNRINAACFFSPRCALPATAAGRSCWSPAPLISIEK